VIVLNDYTRSSCLLIKHGVCSLQALSLSHAKRVHPTVACRTLSNSNGTVLYHGIKHRANRYRSSLRIIIIFASYAKISTTVLYNYIAP
jgi:hypothetical protein